MNRHILVILFTLIANTSFCQLRLKLNDSTTFYPGFEKDFDINYSDTFVYLDSNTVKSLEQIAKFHKENPNFILELGVHQDQLGSELFNLKQSQIRAIRIIEILKTKYDVNINQFIGIGYGESYPLIDIKKLDSDRINNSDNRLQNVLNINRRCTLKILKI